ncbi:MAG: hypothetical protein HY660_11970 [Armatimonadetes bacterium]|nr:hypothetical protein [Armatimonadota bacterium]
MIVADASPLIALAKIGNLGLLRDLYSDVAIAPSVKREVVNQGRLIRAPEVVQVESALAERWVRELQLTAKEKRRVGRLVRTTGLGTDEAEFLALASARHLIVLLDDKEARAVAEAMRVHYLGTAGVLLAAFVRGYLDHTGLEEAVRDLARVLWLSPGRIPAQYDLEDLRKDVTMILAGLGPGKGQSPRRR